MLDVQGLTLTPQEREVIAHPQVGGLILFGRNYDNVQQLTELNREIRECKKNILIFYCQNQNSFYICTR